MEENQASGGQRPNTVVQEGPVQESQQGQVNEQTAGQQGVSPVQVESDSIKTQDKKFFSKGIGVGGGVKKKFSAVTPLLIIGSMLVIGVVGIIVKRITDTPIKYGKKGEVVWWGTQLDEGLVEEVIYKFEEENPGIDVVYVKQSTKDYRERLTNALVNNEAPDIYEIHNTWVPMFTNDMLPLPGEIMSASEYQNTFYLPVVADMTGESGIVGAPLFFDAITLYINDDIFASAAKRAPKTWDELRSIAGDLTQKLEEGVILQSGVALGEVANVDHWPEIVALMMFQNGADLSNPKGNLVEDALNFYVLFSTEDEVWDNTLPASTTAFSRGKTAMYFAPARRAREIQEANPDLSFKTSLLPQLPKQNPDDPDVSYATYWTNGVWNKSKNSQDAWKLLAFATQKEQLETINENYNEKYGYRMPYPRADMGFALINDPISGSVTALAQNAKTWYMAGNTEDGETGINTKLNKAYIEVFEVLLGNKHAIDEFSELERAVRKILSEFAVQ